MTLEIRKTAAGSYGRKQTANTEETAVFNDILHMSFLAGTHVFKAYPAYTTTLTYESALNVVRFVRFQ